MSERPLTTRELAGGDERRAPVLRDSAGVTELDALRRVAAAASRLLELLDLDAGRGRLDLDRFHPQEVAALRDALGNVEALDEADAELGPLSAKRGGERAAS